MVIFHRFLYVRQRLSHRKPTIKLWYIRLWRNLTALWIIEVMMTHCSLWNKHLSRRNPLKRSDSHIMTDPVAWLLQHHLYFWSQYDDDISTKLIGVGSVIFLFAFPNWSVSVLHDASVSFGASDLQWPVPCKKGSSEEVGPGSNTADRTLHQTDPQT